MNENWKNFIQKYGSIHFAKEAFEELCAEILDIHFPGRNVINSNNLDKEKSNKRLVIFLAKFYTENISNSRKSQIRKEFSKLINLKNSKQLEIFSWVLCIPYQPNEEEMKWWLSWSEKQRKENIISLELFDGDFIIEKAKKYGLYDKWFLKAESQETEKTIDEQSEEIISITPIPDKEENKQEDSHKQKDNNNPDKEEIPPTQTTAQQNNKNENTAKEQKTQYIQFDYQLIYQTLKQEYKRIIKLAENLPAEKKELLIKQHSSKNCFDLFNEDEKEIKNQNVLKLFYKAKSNEVNKIWDKALFYYEKIVTDPSYQKSLKLKVSEIIKSLKKVQNYSIASIYELQGDIKKLSGNEKEAVDDYQKAFELTKNDNQYAKKHYEHLADLHLKEERYEEAIKNYKLIPNYKKNKELENKRKKAEHLHKAEKHLRFFPFISMSHLKRAYKISPDDETYKKYQKASNRSIMAVSIILILLISAIFITTQIPQYNKILKNISEQKVKKQKSKDALEIAEHKADEILKNYSIEKIYLLDTALSLYKYVNKIKPSPEINNKIKQVQNIKQNYIDQAQINIKTHPELYFVPLRSFSEGVQLFKYIYDPKNPSKGKYGYVDNNKNIIIPPIYDFNSKIQYDGKENFHNGKAIVCLKTKNKEIFLQIDKKNNIIKKYDVSVFF